jgi:hypothetical protein
VKFSQKAKSVLVNFFYVGLVMAGGWYLSLSADFVSLRVKLRSLDPSLGVPKLEGAWGGELNLKPVRLDHQTSGDDELEILPVGPLSPGSNGREVWLFGMESAAGIARIPNELPTGWERRPDGRAQLGNVILYSGQSQPSHPLKVIMAHDEARINLLRHPWSGAVEVGWRNHSKAVINLYSDSAQQADLYLEGAHTFEVSVSPSLLVFNKFVLKDASYELLSVRVNDEIDIPINKNSFFPVQSSLSLFVPLLIGCFVSWALLCLSLSMFQRTGMFGQGVAMPLISVMIVYLVYMVSRSPWISDDYTNYGLDINMAHPSLNRYPLFVVFLRLFLRPSISTSVLHSITGVVWVITSFLWASTVVRIVRKQSSSLVLVFFLTTFFLLNPLYSQTYLWFTGSYPLWIMFWSGLGAYNFDRWLVNRRRIDYLFWYFCAGIGSFFGEHGVMLCVAIPFLILIFHRKFDESLWKLPIRILLHGVLVLIPYVIFRIYVGVVFQSWAGVQPYKTNFSLAVILDLAGVHISKMLEVPSLQILVGLNLILGLFLVGRGVHFLILRKVRLNRALSMTLFNGLLRIFAPYVLFIVALTPYLLIGGWWTNHYYYIPTVMLTVALLVPLVGYLPVLYKGLRWSSLRGGAFLVGTCGFFMIALYQLSFFNETTVKRIPALKHYVDNYVEALHDVSYEPVSGEQREVILLALEGGASICPVGLFGGVCPATVEYSWVIPGLKKLKVVNPERLVYIVTIANQNDSEIVLNSHDWFITPQQFDELSGLDPSQSTARVLRFDSNARAHEIKLETIVLKRENGQSITFNHV